MKSLSVLYDAGCPICRAARRWLAARPQLVPLEFLAAGSDAARRRFPGLDHDATLRDITVVADTGEVYVGDGAWLACLWALESHRDLAYRLGQPHLLPVARAVVAAASAARGATRDPSRYGEGDDRTDCADERCG
jgi:predicted DCC family thiol-disulfide oxidoreductase YuxK